MSRTEFLNALGINRRTTWQVVLPYAGVAAAGIIVGLGVGMLFAPKSGRQLRSDIGEKAGRLTAKARRLPQSMRGEEHSYESSNGGRSEIISHS